MTAWRRWALPAVLVAGGLIAAILPDRRADDPFAVIPPPAGGRLRYPSDHHATLPLPGGRRQVITSVLNDKRPLRFGDFIWNDAGVAAGRSWVWIDLAMQTISVFRGGDEIGSAVILYGTDGKATPTGIFPILEKAEQHRSTLYDAEMPYMLRLTGDGVAIHASNVREGSATHGCIGVPADFAQHLFAELHRGDRVAILGPQDRAAVKTRVTPS